MYLNCASAKLETNYNKVSRPLLTKVVTMATTALWFIDFSFRICLCFSESFHSLPYLFISVDWQVSDLCRLRWSHWPCISNNSPLGPWFLLSCYWFLLEGFGIDESFGISNNLRFANLPVVSTQACFDELKQTPKEDACCAGYTNGTSVCNGDSGKNSQ